MFARKKITVGEVVECLAVLRQCVDMQAAHITHNVKTPHFRLSGEIFRYYFNSLRIDLNIEKCRNSPADLFRISVARW